MAGTSENSTQPVELAEEMLIAAYSALDEIEKNMSQQFKISLN